MGLRSGARLVAGVRGVGGRVRAGRNQPRVKAEAEAARLIDDVDLVARAPQRLHPRHELLRGEAPRRLDGGVVVLGRDDVKLRLDVHSELDRGGPGWSVVTPRPPRRPPFWINDC